jgi:dihydroorotate dehydrogenase
MGSSNCIHFHFFRPMAFHHLPFADAKETLTRVIGFNLLKNMMTGTNKNYKDALSEVKSNYKSIETVNMSLVSRINAFQKKDASKNAIVILDSFAKIFSLEFSTDLAMFDSFFKKDVIDLFDS